MIKHETGHMIKNQQYKRGSVGINIIQIIEKLVKLGTPNSTFVVSVNKEGDVGTKLAAIGSPSIPASVRTESIQFLDK